MLIKKFMLVVVTVLCCSAAYCQNDQLLIKIGDNHFKGESTATGYKDYIPVLAVNFGVSNTSGVSSPNSKPSFSDISIVHNGSSNSPMFNFYAAKSTVIPSVEILFLKSTGGSQVSPVYKITLSNVRISSVNTSATDDCNSCAFGVENITMGYTKIKWEDIVTNTVAEWDLTSIN